MKSPDLLDRPRADRAAPRPAPVTPEPIPTPEREPDTVIDTSKMSREQREALELTEAARQVTSYRSFAGDLFMGRFALENVYPFPLQPALDLEAGRPFLRELTATLKNEVDPDQIDAEGEIPERVINRLAQIGAFGIKVPKEYGGLGLSQLNYCRAAELLGSTDANLTALLSAHQSIGVPQPLKMFGTEAQKQKYLPRVAHGEISAFALTESSVGSDPAKMTTRAEPASDGKHYILNGEKLWCTNGVKAGVIIVMARTPEGASVDLRSLKGQWLLVSVADAACDALCERQLYLQRQLRESLGREKDRIDRVWLVADEAPVPERLANALHGATVLRVPAAQLAQWLAP